MDHAPDLSAWLMDALAAVAGRPLCLGVVGLPGCGKSTWARGLGALAADAGLAWLAVSLDDFYLEPAARRARGFAHRGPPGTHDLDRVARFLSQLGSQAAPATLDGDGGQTIAVPVFDRDAEQRLPDRVVRFPASAPLRLCIIEGWFVGAPAAGYEGLAAALDRLIYLDMAEADARAARLEREAALRASGRPAMSAAGVETFWAEALRPWFAGCVYPLRERADVVITLDRRHTATALTIRRPLRA